MESIEVKASEWAGIFSGATFNNCVPQVILPGAYVNIYTSDLNGISHEKPKEAETDNDYGRLPLFVTDKEKLDALVSDLVACKKTADVCRAVAKLTDGKIPNEYRQKTFAAALLPILRFDSTESAIYQALYNFS